MHPNDGDSRSRAVLLVHRAVRLVPRPHGYGPMMRRPHLSVPALLFATGIVLVIGVIVTNAVHRAIEHGDGIKHAHNFTSHGVRAALGAVVILGLVLIISGVVWVVATRTERRKHLDGGPNVTG